MNILKKIWKSIATGETEVDRINCQHLSEATGLTWKTSRKGGWDSTVKYYAELPSEAAAKAATKEIINQTKSLATEKPSDNWAEYELSSLTRNGVSVEFLNIRSTSILPAGGLFLPEDMSMKKTRFKELLTLLDKDGISKAVNAAEEKRTAHEQKVDAAFKNKFG